MGPTNVALVKLFQADQKLAEVRERLDAVTRDVRIQRRKVVKLEEQQALVSERLKHERASALELESDVKARQEHIDMLRERQQSAQTNKEYQSLLVDINNHKADLKKIEDQALETIGKAEASTAELAGIVKSLEVERASLAEKEAHINDRVQELEGEIALLQPIRDEAVAEVPPTALQTYDRLCEAFDGEAMSAIEKINPREERYICVATNMELTADIYNRLATRDELVFDPSSGRLLYIPEDVPTEDWVAAKKKKKPAVKRVKKVPGTKAKPAKAVVVEPVAEQIRAEPDAELTPWQKLAADCAKDSTEVAIHDGVHAVEVGVLVDGVVQGYYRARNPEHLERLLERRREPAGGEAAGLAGAVQVLPREEAEHAASNPPAPPPAQPSAQTPASDASDAAGSDPETPDAETPDAEAPQAEASEAQAPEADSPESDASDDERSDATPSNAGVTGTGPA
ncbi:MAG: zinc ribbon domain-containing protein [Phycisphaerae bacterium]